MGCIHTYTTEMILSICKRLQCIMTLTNIGTKNQHKVSEAFHKVSEAKYRLNPYTHMINRNDAAYM